MPSLSELVRNHTDLDDDDVRWLQLLMADWQIVADLSFADLVLWLPDREGKGFWAAGQMRPTTGPTSLVDDVLGTFVPTGRRPLLDAAYERGKPVTSGMPSSFKISSISGFAFSRARFTAERSAVSSLRTPTD